MRLSAFDIAEGRAEETARAHPLVSLGGVMGELRVRYERCRRWLAWTESPVEQMFLAKVIEGGAFEELSGSVPRCLEDQKTGLCVIVQFVMPMMRLDFVFARAGRMLVVEIDGHDFHERTKEQATRDKRRDRMVARGGAHVFRFTGSEVWHDADACVREVLEFFARREATS